MHVTQRYLSEIEEVTFASRDFRNALKIHEVIDLNKRFAN